MAEPELIFSIFAVAQSSVSAAAESVPVFSRVDGDGCIYTRTFNDGGNSRGRNVHLRVREERDAGGFYTFVSHGAEPLANDTHLAPIGIV